MKSWDYIPIEQLCTDIVDCLNRTAPVVEQVTPFKMIRTTNVRHGRLDLDNVKYVEESVYQKWTRRLVPKRGDVILTREAPLGEVAILNSDDRVFLGQRTVMYRVNPEKCSSAFLFYSLRGPKCQAQISAFGSGSTVEHMRVPDSKKIMIPYPPITEREKIAGVLSAYDELIENNLKRIKLLEEKAQQTYEEWFVRMRFPGHESTPIDPATGLPEGWQDALIGDHVNLRYGKALKAADRIEGSVPVYGSSGEVGSHVDHLVSGPGVVLGRKGNVGSVFWSHVSFFPIDTVFYVESELPLEFVFYTLKSTSFVNSDAAVPGLNRKAALARRLVVPSQTILNEFVREVKLSFDLIHAWKEQCAKLEEARDILLPRLMTGMIDVEELDVELPMTA